jgi:eukaryotic-like serine/threonine-protein kinase
MTPERFREIESIFHEARGRAPTERRAWLAERCAGDEGLRREVESLLRQSGGDGLMDAAGGVGAHLASRLARLAPGSSLGTYRIERLLDAGGMGEVYLARDTTLDRDVALKILPQPFMSDPDRLARFEREARLLASLNHPHIGGIYGIVDSEGIRGLVLELIDGPTVADRIRRGALPIAEALRIGREIAEGLEAAHERGVIHRDLKPANIKLTAGGAVKVIDFGLARLADAEAAATDSGESPALPSSTRQGIILGTAAYMSPEQARGERVDKRADVWAFGCVLYEMLTGRTAFDAGTASETIARILEREPDWNAFPATVPPPIRRLVQRCLRKDPALRLHDIADARIELGEAMEPQPPSAAMSAQQRPRPIRLWLGVGAAILVGTIAWVAVRGRSSGPPQPIEFSIHLGDDTPGFGVDVSPDGRRLAIGTAVSGRNRIWIHAFDGSTDGPLRGAEFGIDPFWSPDGTSVGFFSFTTGAVMRTPAEGGPATVVCESPPPAAGGSWNRDGTIVFSSRGRLMKVSASGGAATPIATPGDDERRLFRTFPQFLPDGRHFIYRSSEFGRAVGAMNVGSLDGTPITHILDAERASYADPGYLLFVRGTSLVAQRFDPVRFVRVGDPALVSEGAAAGFLGGVASFSASTSGMLAFVPSRAGNRGQLTWFDRSGRALGSIADAGNEFLNPAVSPSGDRIAANRQDPQTGRWAIWVVDVERGTATPVTDGSSDAFDPVWSPDGRSLAFTRPTETGWMIVARSLETAGTEKRLVDRSGPAPFLNASHWTADGRYLIYLQPVGTAVEIFALPLSSAGTPMQATHNGARSYGARVSPDGKWIAYASNEAGPFEVYVQRFLAPGQKTKISDRAGVHPRWVGDGRELVYWAEPGGVTSVTLEFAGESFRASPPHPLVTTHILTLMDGRPHYDVTRDGRRFLLRQPAGVSGSSVAAIANWTSRLK